MTSSRRTPSPRFTLLGVGAMNSPRYGPAGLLVEHRDAWVAIDGGPGAEPSGNLDAWLVTDDRAELIAAIRRLARTRGLQPHVSAFCARDITIAPQAVVHTSHPTYGYLITADSSRVAWAPEFLTFPDWASGVDLLFAEAATWKRTIWFAKRVGGHAVRARGRRASPGPTMSAASSMPTSAGPPSPRSTADTFPLSASSAATEPSTPSTTSWCEWRSRSR